MKSKCFILIFLMVHKSHSFKANHQIERQTKSIFSNKPCKELFTPARYKIGMKNYNYELPVDNSNMGPYFPDVEYPTNILEASNPCFYKMGESMLGPFPGDVKTSYIALIEKNMKAFEELKSKTDFSFSAKNGLQENIKPTKQEEIIVKEPEDVSKLDNEFVEEIGEVMSGEAQNIVVQDMENTTADEMDSNDTSSESDETVEDIMQNTEIDQLEYKEEVLREDCFQSCESLQYYSDEIKEQLLEAKYIGPDSEADNVTDDALGQTKGNSTLVEAEKPESEINEPDNFEEELCSVPEPDESNSSFDKLKMLDIIKKPYSMNVNKKPFGFRIKPCKKL